MGPRRIGSTGSGVGGAGWCRVVRRGVRCGLAADLKKLKLLHRNCLDRWFMCAFVGGSLGSRLWLFHFFLVFFFRSCQLAKRQICVAVDIYWPCSGHWHQLCMQYGQLIMPLISHRIFALCTKWRQFHSHGCGMGILIGSLAYRFEIR